jgi:hypothetical protein
MDTSGFGYELGIDWHMTHKRPTPALKASSRKCCRFLRERRSLQSLRRHSNTPDGVLIFSTVILPDPRGVFNVDRSEIGMVHTGFRHPGTGTSDADGEDHKPATATISQRYVRGDPKITGRITSRGKHRSSAIQGGGSAKQTNK